MFAEIAKAAPSIVGHAWWTIGFAAFFAVVAFFITAAIAEDENLSTYKQLRYGFIAAIVAIVIVIGISFMMWHFEWLDYMRQFPRTDVMK